jgi:hypothetical protein
MAATKVTNPATLEEARAAKSKVESRLSRNRHVNGIGVTRQGKGWGVKVNLSGPTRANLPREIDGVPVVVELVGKIAKR